MEIALKNGREGALRRGHPWVFSGAIAKVSGNPADGDVVAIKDARGQFVAYGFYSGKTDIAFRVLTREVIPVDAAFWRKRLEVALQLRRAVLPAQTNAWRLINAEGDGFPGLIVDVYGDTLVMSVSTAGMEKQKALMVEALIERIRPERIYEQSAGRSRQLEGLPESRGVLYGSELTGPVRILENGHFFDVDMVNGQKTGFFLDQRVNRERFGALARGASVLNCFCYSGAFSVYMAASGAKRVVSVDISASACKAAQDHLKLNGISPEDHPVIETDAFDYLRGMPEAFDRIILDPPAFAKTKRDVPRALRGYKEINLQAMKRLPQGGMLATFSCSNAIDEETFFRMVQSAATDAHADMQALARLEAGPDHPVALGHPEGRYLKGLLLAKK